MNFVVSKKIDTILHHESIIYIHEEGLILQVPWLKLWGSVEDKIKSLLLENRKFFSLVEGEKKNDRAQKDEERENEDEDHWKAPEVEKDQEFTELC